MERIEKTGLEILLKKFFSRQGWITYYQQIHYLLWFDVQYQVYLKHQRQSHVWLQLGRRTWTKYQFHSLHQEQSSWIFRTKVVSNWIEGDKLRKRARGISFKDELCLWINVHCSRLLYDSFEFLLGPWAFPIRKVQDKKRVRFIESLMLEEDMKNIGQILDEIVESLYLMDAYKEDDNHVRNED